MKMMHSLTATLARVDHGAKSERQKFLFTGDFYGGLEKLAHDFVVTGTLGRIGLVERSDVLFRNNQKMRRCLRMNVANADESLVLVDPRRWNRAGNDFAENAV